MTWLPFIVIFIGLIIGIASAIMARRSKRALLAKPSALSVWLDRFPGTSEDMVREYLSMIAEIFDLGHTDGLIIQPQDQVMEIYKALNPPRWTIDDNMELELFAQGLEHQYGLDLNDHNSGDITFGELFEKAMPTTIN